MDKTVIIGNILTQVALVSITGYFIKRWMDRVDNTIDKTLGEIKSNAALLVTQIDSVHVELKLANGRTAKMEAKLEVRDALCKERHEK
jgi:hypothetical protein